MVWVLLAIGIIGVGEIFLLLPFKNIFAKLTLFSKKALQTISREKVSDHWKQRVLLILAGRLFTSSVSLFLLLVATLLPMAVMGFLGTAMNVDLFGFLKTFFGIAVSTVCAFAYIFIRKVIYRG